MILKKIILPLANPYFKQAGWYTFSSMRLTEKIDNSYTYANQPPQFEKLETNMLFEINCSGKKHNGTRLFSEI
jgi:hypothetical protein